MVSFAYKMAGRQCRSGVLGLAGSAPLGGLANLSGVLLEEGLCVDQCQEICGVLRGQDCGCLVTFVGEVVIVECLLAYSAVPLLW